MIPIVIKFSKNYVEYDKNIYNLHKLQKSNIINRDQQFEIKNNDLIDIIINIKKELIQYINKHKI